MEAPTMAWPPHPDVTAARTREAWRLRARGKTQQQIAAELHMSQSGVSRLFSRSRRGEAERFAREVAADPVPTDSSR
jgi:predicted transcriptional regulator